jgi:hypothetical protein
MRECHTCHQVGHLARNCPQGSAPAAGAATAKKSGNFEKKKSGGDQKGPKLRTNKGSYGPVQKASVNALGNLNLVMDSSMGRETDRAGNHVSGRPAQNASNTGDKEPRSTLSHKNNRCPLFLSTHIFCR